MISYGMRGAYSLVRQSFGLAPNTVIGGVDTAALLGGGADYRQYNDACREEVTSFLPGKKGKEETVFTAGALNASVRGNAQYNGTISFAGGDCSDRPFYNCVLKRTSHMTAGSAGGVSAVFLFAFGAVPAAKTARRGKKSSVSGMVRRGLYEGRASPPFLERGGTRTCVRSAHMRHNVAEQHSRTLYIRDPIRRGKAW